MTLRYWLEPGQGSTNTEMILIAKYSSVRALFLALHIPSSFGRIRLQHVNADADIRAQSTGISWRHVDLSEDAMFAAMLRLVGHKIGSSRGRCTMDYDLFFYSFGKY